MRDDIIERALAERGGTSVEIGQVAQAVINALRLLHAELTLVVGTQAASSLCAHALHRTRVSIGWTMFPTVAATEDQLSGLHKDLLQRTPARALFAGATLISALVDHLVSLIGEPLTLRMLDFAWNPQADDPISREIS
jgi:hypothetical protein